MAVAEKLDDHDVQLVLFVRTKEARKFVARVETVVEDSVC